MFTKIYTYEMKYWMRQPSVYVYAVIILIYSTMLMHGMSGGWDPVPAETAAVTITNSPLKINWMMNFFMQLMLLVIPAVVGTSIYRDFKSRMHTVLYSYPFEKADYLLAKLCSGLTTVIAVSATIPIGMVIGTQLPGVNPRVLADFNFAAYVQAYFIYVMPNLVLFSALIFAVVALTRNIYTGFITLVLLYFLQGITGAVFSGLESGYAAALFDPLGKMAANYETQYWTLAEKNELMLPLSSLVLTNRLIWLAAAIVIFLATYRHFTFSQQASIPGLRKAAGRRIVKQNFGSIIRVALPKVAFDFSFASWVRTTWRLSNIDLRFILKSWMFISILLGGILAVFLQQAQQPLQHGFKILPTTWKMLEVPTLFFSGVINLLTFLYAGILIQRARISRSDQLVDSTPVPNWTLLFSKFLALVKMQILLLSLIMIGGITVQAVNGYTRFEIGHYLFELYCMNLLGHVIWAMAAVFVQTLLTNPYLGVFILVFGGMGIGGLKDIGLEHQVFHFNISPFFNYSDMNGYGSYLPIFYLFKGYWALLGSALLTLTLVFWRRGVSVNIRERLSAALPVFLSRTGGIGALLLFAFVASGTGIYYADQASSHGVVTARKEKQFLTESDARYKRYVNTVQPRIADVKIDMHLFPEACRFEASGEYWLVNKSGGNIDTLIVSPGFEEYTTYDIKYPAEPISLDSVIKFDVWKLTTPLAAGDSLRFTFEVQNMPNTFFRRNSNVIGNGTFIGDDVFPRFFYRTLREEPDPADSSAHQFTYQSFDSDYVNLETVVSTSADQLAIAPGYLQREWRENGRKYYHYKMDQPIKYNFGFNSGRFAVKRDMWQDVELEIYYHPEHDYNLERMMKGLKGALEYQTKYFSPYQHRQARIIEFPLSEGSYATTFANSIPFSEYRFLADVEDSRRGMPDVPFYVAAHELAHQWWGNQVVPAHSLGARMVTESLAEYSALQVLRREYGDHKMRKFLRFDLEAYLRSRGGSNPENPLVRVETMQEHISYAKGALVFYALSDYIGEENLNRALRKYLEKVKFQEAPYTTSLELLSYVRAATPDSLQYFIEDAFEHITLYDNRARQVDVETLENGKYYVTIDVTVSKFRSDGSGNRSWGNDTGDSLRTAIAGTEKPVLSLPLADYIEIGLFAEDPDGDGLGEPIYLKKHRFTEIDNRLSIIVDEKPHEIGIDPYFKLIDAQPKDNLLQVQ